MNARATLAGCFLALGISAVGLAADADSAMDVEVNLVELAEKPGTYDVVAIVRSADDGRLLAAPHMRIAGDQTSVIAVENDSGDRISLSIGPVFRSREAQWLVVWRRGDSTVARAAGRVKVFGEN